MEVISIERSTYGNCIGGMNKKLNSITNPPNIALPSFSYFLVLPHFTFILGQIALIFPNPLFFIIKS